MRLTPMQRWAAKVNLPESPDGCWVWNGATAKGYGTMVLNRRMVPAHRYGYERFVSDIPEGLDLDHLCRNRGCVNPNHLEPVTRRENLMRADTLVAREAAKTHCVSGHPFDAANTSRTTKGHRKCKVCAQLRAAVVRAGPNYAVKRSRYMKKWLKERSPEYRAERNAYRQEWRAKRRALGLRVT